MLRLSLVACSLAVTTCPPCHLELKFLLAAAKHELLCFTAWGWFWTFVISCCQHCLPAPRFSPNSDLMSFNFSSCSHAANKFQNCNPLSRTPSFSMPSQIHVFACCWHCSSFHGSLGPIPGCFKSSDHPMADCFSVCLTPSPAAIRSLFHAPSTRCRMLLLHRCEPSVLTPTSVFDELLLVTILMTRQATSHTP